MSQYVSLNSPPLQLSSYGSTQSSYQPPREAQQGSRVGEVSLFKINDATKPEILVKLAYESIDEYDKLQKEGEEEKQNLINGLSVSELIIEILCPTQRSHFKFEGLDRPMQNCYDGYPISRATLSVLFYLFYIKEPERFKHNFNFDKSLFKEFKEWFDVNVNNRSDIKMDDYYKGYFLYIQEDKVLKDNINKNIRKSALGLLNFSPKNREEYDEKLACIKQFLEKSEGSGSERLLLGNIVRSNPFSDDKKQPHHGKSCLETLKESHRLLNFSSAGLQLIIEIEGAMWERSQKYNFFSVSPSLIRDESIKNNVEINNDSLINYYHTSSQINIRSLASNTSTEFKTEKSRNGAVQSNQAAMEYLLVMLLLNQDQKGEYLYIIDSRYIQLFENNWQGLIDKQQTLLRDVIYNTFKDGLIERRKLKSLIDRVCPTDHLTLFNKSFYNKVIGKKLHFIQLKLCPNNFLGVGLGFNDEPNLAELRAVYRLFDKLLEERAKDGTLSELQKEMADAWLDELGQIAHPPFDCAGLPVRCSLKLAGGIVVVTAAVLASPWLIKASCSNEHENKSDIVSAGVKTAAKVTYDYQQNGKYISGEKAFYTDFLITCLGSLCGVITSGACKSNKDRGSAAQIIEAVITTIWHYRSKKPALEEFSPQQGVRRVYSVLNFELEDEKEKELARQVFEQNIPALVTYCNTLDTGSKSLDGINHLINQAYSTAEQRSWIRTLLKGLQK